jgi:hypothetical protein
MAIAASANLLLVVFDLTYVPWRNFWLQGKMTIPFISQQIPIPMPQTSCPDRSVERGDPPRMIQQSIMTCLYDPIKGIQPHRDTQLYLDTVATLKQQVEQRGLANGLQSPEVQATLKRLRVYSNEMIETNPFEIAGKSGTLEKIKNRMRRRVETKESKRSNREAFELFWSTNYLTPTNWKQEMEWFAKEIEPLMQTNFYRTIGENGEFTNHFWMLDAPFVILFFLEFLARTYYLSRRYPSLRWLDAMFWRWYDIPLFVPFSLFMPVLALSRFFSTAIRLHQAELIDLHEVQDQVRHGVVADLAGELTEVIVVQTLNQVQSSLRQGELTRWLQRSGQKRYVDINNINEIEAIANHFTKLIVDEVFPKIQPDLEALLSHTINNILNQAPAYKALQSLPGIGHLPKQITERLVSDLTQSVYRATKGVTEDPISTELRNRLVQNFTTSLANAAKQENTLPELRMLLSDLIEEIKINYVQRIAEEDMDRLLEQTRQLHQLPRKD